MSTRRREEVVNVILAQSICETGLTADPENILSMNGTRQMPDVLIYLQGLRCAVDGKYDDNPKCREELEAQVSGRLDSGLIHIGVGVAYPAALRSIADFMKLKTALQHETFQFFIAAEAGPINWHSGNLNLLLEQLRGAQASLATDDVVSWGVAQLQLGMDGLTSVLMPNEAACENLAALMGVYEESKEENATD